MAEEKLSNNLVQRLIFLQVSSAGSVLSVRREIQCVLISLRVISREAHASER